MVLSDYISLLVNKGLRKMRAVASCHNSLISHVLFDMDGLLLGISLFHMCDACDFVKFF
jgi:hypothetical protein